MGSNRDSNHVACTRPNAATSLIRSFVSNHLFCINFHSLFLSHPHKTARFPTATRRPPPPLIRDTDNVEDTDAEINSIFGNNRPATNNRPPPPINNVRPQQQPWATATRRPPPPLIHNTEDDTAGQPTNQFGK